jgi:hypothetical protein
MQFVVNFSNEITLIYDIVDADISMSWSELISSSTVNNCCKINHYVGYASESLITERIQQLYYLSDIINRRAPDRVIKQEITRSTWSQALQVMHVHFPDLKNDISYQDIWHILSEYNDIIHWLESILLNVWGNIPYTTNSSLFRVTLDFNKSTNTFLPIPIDAYTLCEPAAQFGDLLLHYTHVGKHAQELFSVNDLVCPESQFVPQTLFNASCRMLFTDYFYDTVQKKENLKQRWEQFYIERGGYEFWKYEVNDPRIQFGYLKIGSLTQIVINKNQYPIPKTVLELVKFRRKISESTVIDWNIRGA